MTDQNKLMQALDAMEGQALGTGPSTPEGTWSGIAKGRALKDSRARGFKVSAWANSGTHAIVHSTGLWAIAKNAMLGRDFEVPFVFPVAGTTDYRVERVSYSNPDFLVCRTCGGLHGSNGGFRACRWLADVGNLEKFNPVVFARNHFLLQVGFLETDGDGPVSCRGSRDVPTMRDVPETEGEIATGLTWSTLCLSRSCACQGDTVQAHYLNLANRVTEANPLPQVEYADGGFKVASKGTKGTKKGTKGTK